MTRAFGVRRAAAAAGMAAIGIAAAVAAPTANGAQPAAWAPVLVAAEGVDHLSAFPNGVAYAQYGNGIERSTDYGITWSALSNVPAGVNGTQGIARFLTARHGFALTGQSLAIRDPHTSDLCPVGESQFGLWETTDAGQHWVADCAPTYPLQSHKMFTPGNMYASRDGRVLMIMGTYDESPCKTTKQIHPMVYTTADGGTHWHASLLPGGNDLGWIGASMLDARHATLIGGAIRGTCTGGQEIGNEWVWLTSDGVHYRRAFRCPDSACTAATWVTRRRVVVGLADGRTFVSVTGGRTFERGQLLRSEGYQAAIDSGQVDAHLFWVQAVSFVDDKVGYASTRGSGTWRTTDGGFNWVQETSPECSYYPFGVGDIAAAGREHGITGGPRNIDARMPGAASLGCGTVQQQAAPLAAPAVVVRLPRGAGEATIDAVGRMRVSRTSR